MPRYTKTGGAKGYRKKYKTVNHDEAQKVLQNLTPLQFKQLQEIARHGLGMYTVFRELLSEHPKTKVKPSSFQKYASANNPQEVIHAMQAEKNAHDDPTSETHLGGGLRDAHNAVGRWAFDASNMSNMNWALDQLDPRTLTDQTDLGGQAFSQGSGTRQDEYQTDHDWILEVLYELDQLHKQHKKDNPEPEAEADTTQVVGEQYVPHENPVIEQGNQFMDTMGWIGGILGSTVDFLSDFDTTD